MNIYDIIEKKKRFKSLEDDEIRYFIEAYTREEIPDYQMSALLMAIFFAGMDSKETVALTKAMMYSGDVVDLSGIEGIKVDKHSTGGIGDKTTLVLIPMLASCGLTVAKMSGRSLGFTGGTIDKLESIRNFRTSYTRDEFFDAVRKRKVVIAAQTASIAPADKKLYALRDATNTVDNISLIASSIMSKKLACGADNIILDVKIGSGSFMKELEDAERLAMEMVNIAKGMSKNACAVISDMNQPLGNAVGNALEVAEAVRTLRGEGPDDLMMLCLELGANLLVLCNHTSDVDEARDLLTNIIESGQAYEKFIEIVAAQDGDVSQLEDINLLPTSRYSFEVKSRKSGYVDRIDSTQIGMASSVSGAGRQSINSQIDYGAGLIMHKKLADFVNEGESIATVFSSNEQNLFDAVERVSGAYSFSEHVAGKNALIHKVIK